MAANACERSSHTLFWCLDRHRFDRVEHVFRTDLGQKRNCGQLLLGTGKIAALVAPMSLPRVVASRAVPFLPVVADPYQLCLS